MDKNRLFLFSIFLFLTLLPSPFVSASDSNHMNAPATFEWDESLLYNKFEIKVSSSQAGARFSEWTWNHDLKSSESMTALQAAPSTVDANAKLALSGSDWNAFKSEGPWSIEGISNNHAYDHALSQDLQLSQTRSDFTVIAPEPASTILLFMGGLPMAMRAYRRRKGGA